LIIAQPLPTPHPWNVSRPTTRVHIAVAALCLWHQVLCKLGPGSVIVRLQGSSGYTKMVCLHASRPRACLHDCSVKRSGKLCTKY